MTECHRTVQMKRCAVPYHNMEVGSIGSYIGWEFVCLYVNQAWDYRIIDGFSCNETLRGLVILIFYSSKVDGRYL